MALTGMSHHRLTRFLADIVTSFFLLKPRLQAVLVTPYARLKIAFCRRFITSSLSLVLASVGVRHRIGLSPQEIAQIVQVGETLALAGMCAFEGCPPDQFTLAPYLPQTQQVG
jgi:hypothetical protein